MKRVKIINKDNIQIGKTQYNGEDLVDNLYESLAEYLTNGKVMNKSHIANVLKDQFNAFEAKAKDDPANLANIKQLMSISKETSDYYLKKQAQDKDFSEYLLYKDLMKWQKDVWNDTSKRIALPAGRRSGKSYVIAALALRYCLIGSDNIKDPKTGLVYRKQRQCYIIGLTIGRTADIYWQPLKDLIEKTHIPYLKIDNGAYVITLSNGAEIHLYGNNSKAEREKLRGIDAGCFMIDECQSQASLTYLLESIIGPIVTGRDGYIVLAGTGPIAPMTYWERVMDGKEGYSVHRATMLDNTSIPNYSEALAKILEENHWTEDNLIYRREYLCEAAFDLDRMIYPVRFYYKNIPSQKVRDIYVGLDFGWTDATAIAPIVTLENGQSYLVAEVKQTHMTASEIIDQINTTVEYLSTKYHVPYNEVHVRCDWNESNIVRDIQNKYPQMDIQLAIKRDESAFIALVNDLLRSGDLQIAQDGPFDEECAQAVWKVADNGRVLYGNIDDEVYHMDQGDAVRYAVSSMFSDNSFIERA